MQHKYFVYICVKIIFMFDICIYLELEGYLRDWLIHKYGNPVRFIRNSAENDILETFLATPKPDTLPDLPTPNKVAIALPSFKYKDTRTYNYLPPKAKDALSHCIKVNFRVKMWKDLHTLANLDGCITDIIYAWMEQNGIELTEKNWETIRQMYFRKRKIYREKELKKKIRLPE